VTAIAERTACRLYLTTPPELVSGGIRLRDFLDRLAPAFEATDAACLLIAAPAETGDDALGAIAKPLIEMAQRQDIAALLPARAELAKRLGADGVHLDLRGADTATALGLYRDARRVLGGDAIVGALLPAERHAAMELAEAGADYIGFDSAADAASELIAWWAEVMTVPCVAFGVGDPETARRLAGQGADFIAIEPKAWLSVDPAPHLEMFRAAIRAG